MGSGKRKSDIMIIGEAPGQREDEEHRAFVGSAGRVLDSVLTQVGIDRDSCYVTNVAKCRPPGNRTPDRSEIKVCTSTYLVQEFEQVKPSFVLLLGNSALRGVIGRSGITKYNGVVYKVEVAEGHVARVMGTVHPAAVLRNPRYKDTFAADIVRFANLTRGVSTEPQTEIHLVKNARQLKWLINKMMEVPEISWDVETATEPVAPPFVRGPGQDWWADESYITSIAFSWEEGKSAAFLLDHPDTPWRSPADVLEACRPFLLRKDAKYIAHNGKFDARWMHSKGIPVRQDFDTMLAAHMLDENRLKGLKPLSKILLGAAPYNEEVDTKQTRLIPGRKLLHYNAKDTDYTLRLYHIFRKQLREEPRIARVFTKLMMPASNALVDIERHGVWVDPERWEERYLQAQENRDKIDRFIQQYWPEANPLNLNAPQQVGRLLFNHLELPILERSKKTKAPSTKESVLLRLEDEHVVCKAIIKYRKWAKYVNTYLGPWKYEHMDEGGRIHSTYKLYGTVTGRLSGEGGIQQVPRDPFIRSVIGAPPGWKFLQADYSQVELRVVAWLSNERHMIRQFLNGEDIHMARAMKQTGKIRPEEVTKEERKRAKPVSFGYVYGMGAKKFVGYAFDNYGIKITQDEAERDRSDFFEDYPGLRPWHERQRRLARKYHRVNSPLGRVRHLPDILSADEDVRQESERQAINSPVQSFASDLMLLSLVELHLRMDPQKCRIVGTVHDSILFEVREDAVAEYAPFIKEVMEDMSIVRKKFGTEVTVPIVADIEVGDHWGEGKPWTG
jgi:DNA polymerase-1